MVPVILGTLAISISRATSRRLLEIGLAVGIVGAIIVIWGSLHILRAMRSRDGAQRPHRARERVAMLAGFALITIGFGLQFMGQLTRILGP